MLAHRNLALGTALLVWVLALSACGGGARRHAGAVAAPSVDPAAEPNAVVVQVGGHAITRAMFAHSLSAAVRSEGPNAVAPVPPDFAACIKHLEADSALAAPSGHKLGVAELKDDCQQQYQKLETRALDRLISEQWVIGGAAEEGVQASNYELQLELKRVEGGQSQAQVAHELTTSGRTLADFALETKAQLLAEGIRHVLARNTAHVTTAQVVNYYDQHKYLFAVPKRRDLEIARAGSEAEALRLKRDIASGKTFANIVRKLPLQQPIFSMDGMILNYEPGLYREPPLDHAIFAARPNALSGPVKINLGYYVFEIKRVHPPQQKTLAEVQTTIRQRLPDQRYKRALTRFVSAWRKRWRARTDCRPGYVVVKCRQFKGSGATPLEHEDPYTLN